MTGTPDVAVAATSTWASRWHDLVRRLHWLNRLRPERIGLRRRVMLSFAFGGFLVSTLLSLVTILLSQSSLVRQRVGVAEQQLYRDAVSFENSLQRDPSRPQDVIAGLQPPAGTSVVVFVKGEWIVVSGEASSRQLPPPLVESVITRFERTRMLSRFDNRYLLTLGIPLPSVGSSFFEVVDMSDSSRTLRSITLSLVAGSAITTTLSVLLGVWAAARVTRPITAAAQAANALANGRLDTRLDLTDDRDMRVLASAFNDMARSLEERVERDARFASDVSHELRSPLTTLSASIEVMQARRAEMPERAQSALDLMTADVTRFRGLVEDLLEISRFDAGAVRLNLDELLVAEFVRQAVSVSSAPDTPVEVSDAAESMIIRGDKRRLARVLANLIDNGRNYGGGVLRVLVEEVPDEFPATHVLIIVQDSGPGVAPEERNLIFQRFARGLSSGRRGVADGAGLGLALVDEHVKLHGGTVRVVDRPDGESGARFVIELPAEPV